jgi:drug/metabolite transporter (DMT)-like permease
MTTGGVVMLGLSVATGEWAGFDPAAVPAQAWVAFGYLTLIGSIVAFSAFVWLLHHAPPSLVTTYAFVNPVVAVILGWLVLGEQLTTALAVGGLLAVVGVALVIRGESRPTPSPTPTSP